MRALRVHPSIFHKPLATHMPATVKQLYVLSKPRIISLTLVAACAGIYVGSQGALPQWPVLLWTLSPLALITAGACMLNNVYDRDIDRLMTRTRKRPLARGDLAPRRVLVVGLLLILLPLPPMAMKVNITTAALTAAAAFGYVVIYTMLAKRRTPWANQLGGIAGALPPVIGVAAVSNAITPDALVLFALMAVWQQPHALTLALKYRADYARAGVPVVPVAKGVATTKRRIFIYSIVLLAVSLLPYVTGMAGAVYLLTATVLGLLFSARAARFLLSRRDCDMKLFFFSLLHLVALCIALVLDFARI